jgi:hypothetical protein
MRIALSLLRMFLGICVSFCLAISVGTSALLAIINLVGYLPYSDRPGPGWQGFHWPSSAMLEQTLGFFVGWIPMLAVTCLYFGLGLALLGLLFQWLSLPRSLVRLLGAVLAGCAAALATAAAGWYIALGEIGAALGLLCGVVWGVFVLPRFVGSRETVSALWLRITAGTLGVGVFLYWTISPLIPDRDAQSLRVEVVRIVPGEQSLTSGFQQIPATERTNNMVGFGGNLTEEDATLLNKSGVRGRLYGGLSTELSVGGATREARALIVVTEPLERPVLLRQPKAARVIYLERRGEWTMIPPDAPTIRKKIRLTPVQGDATKIKAIIDSQASNDGTTFSWYPAMATR